MEVFVVVDWAEEHHDVCVMDTGGRVRATGRIDDDLAGIAGLYDLIAGAVPAGFDEDEVVVTVGSRPTVACWCGCRSPPNIGCWRSSRWPSIGIGIVIGSGAKSDPGDAAVLADMIRTDAHQHRLVAADSDLAEGHARRSFASVGDLVASAAGEPGPLGAA